MKQILIITCMLLSLQGWSQELSDRQQLIDKRLVKINRYHAGVALTAEANHNLYFGPQAFWGFGSTRSRLCVDVGVKYLFGTTFNTNHNCHVSLQQMAVYAAADVNAVRWSSGSAYIGGSADYRFSTSCKYYDDENSLALHDSHIAQSHMSLQGRIGVKWGERWKTELSYTYDLAPTFDQKYVFESPLFNYVALRDYLYERSRFGVTLYYLLPF